jgi:acetate kinase
MADAILTLNAGSSRIKFSRFEIGDSDHLTLASFGEVEGIGVAPHFIAHDASRAVLAEQTWPDPNRGFQSLLESVISWAEGHLGADTLMAVGHHVVHAEPHHDRPELVTPALLTMIAKLTPLAPLHIPHDIAPITAIVAAIEIK